MEKFRVRIVTVEDIPELKEVYKSAVLFVSSRDYSPEEVEDWASCGDDDVHWVELITGLYFIAALNNKGKIAGFSSVSKEGYLHSMFIHEDFQRKGVASLLYREIEEYVSRHGVSRISSEVSITARPFFERQGFTVDEEQKRKANRLCLTNYKMSKQLNLQGYVSNL